MAEKELTVQPKNCFLFVPFVTIVIPVENNEKTAVKFLTFFIALFVVGSAGETRTLTRLPSRILVRRVYHSANNALK